MDRNCLSACFVRRLGGAPDGHSGPDPLRACVPTGAARVGADGAAGDAPAPIPLPGKADTPRPSRAPRGVCPGRHGWAQGAGVGPGVVLGCSGGFRGAAPKATATAVSSVPVRTPSPGACADA
ncbi:hypothetical protein GCM10019016_044510 [Streptomyces prasinosporus]|uniref:Uncharacterized protein n=1 Tax=Streptomyces prasinosporus TaxID=68256 RepID=A0ABP6TRJ2_9ACTN|nr:hypothetical protein GCM10010332_63840 [Streptomyces albogriseolus]